MSWIVIVAGVWLAVAGLFATIYSSALWAPQAPRQREAGARRIGLALGLVGVLACVGGGWLVLAQLQSPH